MSNTQKLTCKATAKANLLIQSVDPTIPLEQPIYAINWFNTNREWMYTLYNILVARPVLNVGGRVFFKGEVVERLLGNDQDHRRLLLIVKYPSAFQFKQLAENWYFKLMSIFRIKSVKKFSFGFTSKKELTYFKTRDKSKVYAFHHYRKLPENQVKTSISQLQQLAKEQQVDLLYAGDISSLLFYEKKGHDPMQLNCILDGLFFYAANDAQRLKQFFVHEAYQSLLSVYDSNYIALLNREI